MRSLSFFVAAWLLSVVCEAQQSPAPAVAEKDAVATLRKYLRETAAGPTSFEARWLPTLPSAMRGNAPNRPTETATGSFGPDWLLVEMQGDKPQTSLQVGRHTITRSKGNAWQLAGPKQIRIDGNDPPLLLHVLATTTSAVAARSIAERGGVPVEQFTLCLDVAQAEMLAAAGVMHDPSPAQAVLRSMIKSGQAAGRDSPVPIVDVCLDVDVGTHRIQRIFVRAMCKSVDLPQLLANTMRRQRAGEKPATAEAPTPEASPPAEVPKQFQDGLPVRSEEGMDVVWLEIVLRDHGKAPAVVLDDQQKALLGR